MRNASRRISAHQEQQLPPLSTERRRRLGSFYTPESITRPMVAACLDSCQHRVSGKLDVSLRILDPACGDGAFIVETFSQLATAASSPRERIAVIREHLYGVDLDDQAILELRERLRLHLGEDCAGTELEDVLRRNFRVGDALTGPAFGEDQPNLTDGESADFDWNCAFPQVAKAGGFDVVIGNPPYLRERDARDLFARLAETSIGRRWRRARMDLWHYFVHRGLDLLRPGGTLSFVVNSYWTASRGAEPLIERLRQETTFQEIRLLGNQSLFVDVSGRHMIFRAARRSAELGDQVEIRDESSKISHRIMHHELFHSGRILLTPPPSDGEFERWPIGFPLGSQFETRQGIAENPPRISPSLAREFPEHFVVGEGVFVLRSEEVEQLQFSTLERQLLRPYYETSAIGRYTLAEQPTHSILYLTRQTAPSLEPYPRVAAHLERFRKLLERRREVERGRIAWWHLHWPRVARIFTEPRILSVQMGKRPQFVFVERPTFVGFSVNVILPQETAGMPLDALVAVLNSHRAAAWFQRHAKQRGVNLDISGGVLREFPLPDRDPEIERRVGELVRRRQSVETRGDPAECEVEIEQVVGEWYGVG